MNKTIHTLILSLLFVPLGASAQVNAAFTAQEAMTTYYEQGWDDDAAYSSWTYSGINPTNTWGLVSGSLYSGQQPFSSVDPKDKYSLGIKYDMRTAQDERATSPEIVIQPNSSVEFYAMFSAVWLYQANWTFSVIDVEKQDTTLLTNGFMWSQDNAYTGPNWVKFENDLSTFAGRKCQFEFRYRGTGGDNLQLDGFKIRRKDTSATSSISINQGETVHFVDLSTGNPTQWQWTFDGGTPATSTSQNPEVTYPQAGVYSVSLTASDATSSSSVTRETFVTVKAQAPSALIGLPAEGYLSPWVAAFVPTNVPVTFTDKSTGYPTGWSWTFEGGTPPTSSEQNPVVTYTEPGIYGLTLDVDNSVGTSNDFMVKAIQAGGSQDVWNIGIEEYDVLGTAELGWYGYYGGTNWLGMVKYAEEFSAPAVAAPVDSVSIYFDHTTTVTPDAPITVAICAAADNGEPGEELATATFRADEIAYDAHNIVATKIALDKPAEVNGKFFVVVGGIPNNSNENGTDDISILSVVRDEGQKTTTWHLLEEWDEQGQPTGNVAWYKNTDSPLSLALTAHLTYVENTSDGIENVVSETTSNVTPETVYSVGGARRQTLGRGINIVRMSNGKVKKILR